MMKYFQCLCIVSVVAITAFSAAELPPSNSYLPPSPASRNPGYAQASQPGPSFPGAPQVIAARNLERGSRGHGNDFSRSNSHDHTAPARLGAHDHTAQARLGASGGQGYDENAAFYGRNEIDANSEPANYNFGYMVTDYEGTDFGHHEERLQEKAQGEYHVVLPDGRKQTVSYEADERGFNPQVSYQDTEELTRAGGYGVDANTRSHGNGYQNGGRDDTRGY